MNSAILPTDIPTPTDEPTLAPTAIPTLVPTQAPLPDNYYKSYIYSHESGNRTWAINASSGACGLGQALPCTKLPCNLQDYACQDNFFTSYMLNRYGSWENAYNWWVNHSWW